MGQGGSEQTGDDPAHTGLRGQCPQGQHQPKACEQIRHPCCRRKPLAGEAMPGPQAEHLKQGEANDRIDQDRE